MIRLLQFTKRQILTLIAFAFAEFFNAICVSLQAPFFPQEAELKGATATEYGAVFGVFELVVFLISPWYGRYLNVIGPKKMFFSGIITSAICSILFGLLDLINSRIFFITSAFTIRIIEAMGNAAFLTAGFAIIANEFPQNIASTFASLETFFGLGLVAGPTIGGVLYQFGGFKAPFVALGVCLFVCVIFTRATLPSSDKYQTSTPPTGKIWEILRVKGIAVCCGIIVTTAISISFISATLEPHIRQFHLSAVQVGVVFIVNGAVYGVTAPAWGWLCDSKWLSPKAISVLGGIVLLVGVSFIGPAPFMPVRASLSNVILGLILHGFSIGARLVSSFTDALRVAIAAGMPNSIETYGIISSLWTSSVALGSFIGPTVSGFLYDNYGFAKGSLFVIVLIAVMLLFECWSLIHSRSVANTEKIDTSAASAERLTYDTGGISAQHVSEANSSSAELIIKHNIGVSSNKVLNLVYSSNSDLIEETSPLLAESDNRSLLVEAAA